MQMEHQKGRPQALPFQLNRTGFLPVSATAVLGTRKRAHPGIPGKAYLLASGRIDILCSYGSSRLSSPPRPSMSLAFNLNAMDAEGHGGKGGVMNSGKHRDAIVNL